MGFNPGFTSTLTRVAAVILIFIVTVSPELTSNIEPIHKHQNNIDLNKYAELIQQGVNLSAVMSIFAPVSDQVKNEQCRKDSHIFLRELHRFTLWATQSKYNFYFIF